MNNSTSINEKKIHWTQNITTYQSEIQAGIKMLRSHTG